MAYDKIKRPEGCAPEPVSINPNSVEPGVCDTVSCMIKGRRSIRKYLQKDVPDKTLEWLFDAAKAAPSAGNYQPWEFVVVRNPEMKSCLSAASFNQNWMAEAPVLIVACVNMRLASAVYGERGAKLYGIQAVAAAIENMLIMAHALELGTCWIGAFAETVVSRLMECPEYVRPCAIISVGYPDERPKVPSKQGMHEFVHIGKFGDTLHTRKVEREKRPTYMKFQ